MARSDFISGIVLFVASLIFFFYVIPTQTVSDPGDDTSISPALLPNICVLGIMVLSAMLVVTGIRRGKADESASGSPVISGRDVGALLSVLVAVGTGIVLFIYVNPAIAGAFVLISLMLYMGERRWYFLAGIPAVFLIGAYILFYKVLGTAIG